MNYRNQEGLVGLDHYSFSTYITKKRWTSYWHQLDEVYRLHPNSILEIGKGSGIFSIISKHINEEAVVKTLDFYIIISYYYNRIVANNSVAKMDERR